MSEPVVNHKPTKWFTETHKDETYSLEMKEVLFKQRTPLGNEILVFKSESKGNVLVFNGVIQMCEADEFMYHEISAHVPLNCHPNPKDILIIGGGDGGMAREALKHACVESITNIDIEKLTSELARKHFPRISCKLDDPKVHSCTGNGVELIKISKNRFDIIIIEICPDEVGEIATVDFWKSVRDALKPGGIVMEACYDIYYHMDQLLDIITPCAKVFASVDYASVYVPIYGDQTGLILASSEKNVDFSIPIRSFDVEQQSECSYYNKEIHRAAFAKPEYVNKELDKITNHGKASDV